MSEWIWDNWFEITLAVYAACILYFLALSWWACR